MSAVAGLFAQFIGEAIQQKFESNEIVVENGGDIYLNVTSDIDISIYAGKSSLSNCIAIQVPVSESPLGICTSSGTVGHSLSFGKSDAVAVSCKNTAVADAWATRLGNEVKSEADIKQALAISAKVPEILSTLIIVNDKMGVHGKFKIKPVITNTFP